MRLCTIWNFRLTQSTIYIRIFRIRELNCSEFLKQILNVLSTIYLINKFTYVKNLLTDTDMDIKKISAIIGYSSITQFHNTFKKLFNTAQNKYRKLYPTPPVIATNK